MCGPLVIPIAMAAMAALSVAQQAQQSHQQNQQFARNADVARQAQQNAGEGAGLDAQARFMSATQEATQNALAAARARATVATSAGESGIAGSTVDSITNDITRTEQSNLTTIQTQQNLAEAQEELQSKGYQLRAQSQIDSAPQGSFNPYIGLLQVGAAGASSYAQQKYGT